MSNGNSAEASTSPSPVPSSVGNAAPKFGTLVPNRVFVGGISASTTEQDLHELFSKYGKVKATKVISDRAGVSKGYGFVTFETEDEARKLTQEADNVILKERKLNIAPAIKKQVTDVGYIKPFSPRLVDGTSSGTVIGANGTVFFSNGQPYAYTGGLPVMASPTDFPQTVSPASATLPSYPPQVPHSAAATAVTQAAGMPASTYPSQFVYPQPVYFPQQYHQQYQAATIQPQWGAAAQQQWRWVSPGAYAQPEPCSPNHSQSPSQLSTVKSSQNCPANNAFTHLPYPNSFLPPFSVSLCSQGLSLDTPSLLTSSFMVDSCNTVPTTCTTTIPSTSQVTDKVCFPCHDYDGTLLVKPLNPTASTETNGHYNPTTEETYNGCNSSPTVLSKAGVRKKKSELHLNNCQSPPRNDKCPKDGNSKTYNYQKRVQPSKSLTGTKECLKKRTNRTTLFDSESSKSDSLRSSPDVLTAFVENASTNLNSEQVSAANGCRYTTAADGGWPLAQPYYLGWPTWCPQHNLPAPFVQQPAPCSVPVWQLGHPVKMLPSSPVNSENSVESWETLESPKQSSLRPPVRSSTPNNVCGEALLRNGLAPPDSASSFSKSCPKEDYSEQMAGNPYAMAGGNPIMMMPWYQQVSLVNPPWYQWGYPVVIQHPPPPNPAPDFCPYSSSANSASSTKLARQQPCIRVPYHLQSPPSTKASNYQDRNFLNLCKAETKHSAPFKADPSFGKSDYTHQHALSSMNMSADNLPHRSATLPRLGPSFRCLRRLAQLPDDKCALLPISPPLTPLQLDHSDHMSIY